MIDEDGYQVIDVGGVPISFKDRGTGPAVVFIHGFTGNTNNWDPAVPLLAPHFRLVTIDCRGHGRSGKPKTAGSYGLEMVGDVLAVIQSLQIKKAHLVGYSMGAEIALRFAVSYPELVSGLVVGGSGWSGVPETSSYEMLGTSLKKHGSFGPILRALTPEGTPLPSDEEVAQVDSLLEGQDLEALSLVAAGMGEIINLTEVEVMSISVPTLAISGEFDPERANLEKMLGVLPGIKLSILMGRDHLTALEDPGMWKSMQEFLVVKSLGGLRK